MRIFGHIVHLLIVIALISMPNAQFGSSASDDDVSYDTCVSDWQGSWADLSAISADENSLSKSVEEVFCNHFMSVEDIPVENNGVEAAVTTPLFLAQPTRLFEPANAFQKTALPTEDMPHSLASEVAPHPPKKG